jgi:hypothetical protein
MIRKDVIFAVLATFCMAIILFTVVPVGSYGTYDPWMDLNDDGKIDVRDIAPPCSAYGATGTPINKTELLLELQSRLDSLNSSVLALQALESYLQIEVITMKVKYDAKLVELQSTIDSLNASLTEQESRVDMLEEMSNRVKTVRLLEPNETYVGQLGVRRQIASLTWIPQNSTCNAIVSMVVYFEYKCNGRWGFELNGRGIGNVQSWNAWSPYRYSPVETPLSWEDNFQIMGFFGVNAPSYTFLLDVIGSEGIGDIGLYVRNINVVITVIDGLPPT